MENSSSACTRKREQARNQGIPRGMRWWYGLHCCSRPASMGVCWNGTDFWGSHWEDSYVQESTSLVSDLPHTRRARHVAESEYKVMEDVWDTL